MRASSEGTSWWWLRSPGYFSYKASGVNDSGYVNDIGDDVDSISYGVRPALHINLSSSSWESAGTIDSEGNVTEPETTEGAFLKEGDKLRWQDTKIDEDGLFVKSE